MKKNSFQIIVWDVRMALSNVWCLKAAKNRLDILIDSLVQQNYLPQNLCIRFLCTEMEKLNVKEKL